MKKWLVAMAGLGLAAAGSVAASEGVAEIYSLRGRKERCFLVSVLLPTNNYRVVASCRDLIFPPGQGVYGYAVWGNPVEGGDPLKLGSLGVGKAEFSTPKAFNSVYVSEDLPVARQGITNKVFPPALMRGDIRLPAMLARDDLPPPTPILEEPVEPTGGPKTDNAKGSGDMTLKERIGTWFARVLGVLFAVGILVVLAAIVVMSLGGRKKYPPGV